MLHLTQKVRNQNPLKCINLISDFKLDKNKPFWISPMSNERELMPTNIPRHRPHGGFTCHKESFAPQRSFFGTPHTFLRKEITLKQSCLPVCNRVTNEVDFFSKDKSDRNINFFWSPNRYDSENNPFILWLFITFYFFFLLLLKLDVGFINPGSPGDQLRQQGLGPRRTTFFLLDRP